MQRDGDDRIIVVLILFFFCQGVPHEPWTFDRDLGFPRQEKLFDVADSNVVNRPRIVSNKSRLMYWNNARFTDFHRPPHSSLISRQPSNQSNHDG